MSLNGKRILIAKPGLDGHDVGAKVIALALRDAGADVIYTGLRKSPEYIARIAVEEDVHCVGLSILSGSHKELLVDTLAELKKADAEDMLVFVGGTIPPGDQDDLRDAGASGVYTSDMKIDDVISHLSGQLAGSA